MELSTIYYPHEKILLPLPLSLAGLTVPRSQATTAPSYSLWLQVRPGCWGTKRHHKGPGSAELQHSRTVQKEGNSVNSLRNNILPEDSAFLWRSLKTRENWILKISKKVLLYDTLLIPKHWKVSLEKEGMELFLFERHLFEKMRLSLSKMVRS